MNNGEFKLVYLVDDKLHQVFLSKLQEERFNSVINSLIFGGETIKVNSEPICEVEIHRTEECKE